MCKETLKKGFLNEDFRERLYLELTKKVYQTKWLENGIKGRQWRCHENFVNKRFPLLDRNVSLFSPCFLTINGDENDEV